MPDIHPPSVAPTDHARVVVTSLGSAGFGIVNVLERYCPLPGPELAAALYRAPGILFSALPRDRAEQLAVTLRGSGLELEVQELDDPFEAGVGNLDVLLEIRDFTKASALIAAVSNLLGIDARAARDLMCQSPCQLVGKVSVVTAVAISRRFEALGAEVIVIEPATARYDLIVTARSPQLTSRILENLRGLGREALSGALGDLPVVEDLDFDSAVAVWEALGRRADAARIVAREAERFDVVLDSCPETDDAVAVVALLVGKPPEVVRRILPRLPAAITSGCDRDTMAEHLTRLAAASAQAHAELTTFETFKVEITSAPKPAAVARILHALLDLPISQAAATLDPLPVRLEGPFSGPRARWLRQELVAVGCKARLVPR